jgi:hypothetical protein
VTEQDNSPKNPLADRTLIGDAWKKYRDVMIPSDAPDIQSSECRKAFYAGADASFSAIVSAIASEHVPTDEDIETLYDVERELIAFLLEMTHDGEA